MKIRVGLLALVAVTLAGCDKQLAYDRASVDTTAQAPRPSVDHWGRLLSTSSSRADQLTALEKLGEYQLEAALYVPVVSRYLESRDDSLAVAAAWTMTHLGPDANPPLLRALKNPRSDVRRRAAFALGQKADGASEAVPDLNRLIADDRSIDVRYMASWAVDRITNRAVVADPNLLRTAGLRDSDLKTRLEAIRRLGSSHPSDAVAVAVLIPLMGDSNKVIRYAAIDALVAKGAPAVPALTMALNHPRQIIRTGAMMAMARMHRSL